MNVLDLLEMDQGDPEWLLAELVGELLADEPETPTTVVVLDDAHLLSPDDWGLLGRPRRIPPSVHPVLISRSDPPIALGRQRAQGLVAEIPTRSRLRPRQTRELLASASIEPTAELARTLLARTEGWVAGIRLAALAIHDGADPDELLHRFSVTNTSVAEFLLEEVLDRQSEQRRDFLLTVAIFRILDPEICDAVTGRSDSADTLRTIAADGIFLTRVERQSDEYRFHPLLAELLRHEQRHRNPEAARRHHRLAAEWLVAHDRGIEAIEHLLDTGDHAQAHDLVVRSFNALYTGPHRPDLDLWLTAIPDGVIAESLDRAMDHCVALTLVASPDGPRWWEFCADRVGDNDAWLQSRLECVLAVYDAVNARTASMRTHWKPRVGCAPRVRSSHSTRSSPTGTSGSRVNSVTPPTRSKLHDHWCPRLVPFFRTRRLSAFWRGHSTRMASPTAPSPWPVEQSSAGAPTESPSCLAWSTLWSSPLAMPGTAATSMPLRGWSTWPKHSLHPARDRTSCWPSR